MLCYDERHPTLLDCAMIFIICIRKVGGAANIILSPLWFTQCYYCSMLPFNLHTKYEIFGYPLRMAKWMPYCEGSHSLLLKYFMTYLSCMRRIRWASDRIYRPHVAHIVPFLPNVDSQLEYKITDFGHPLSTGYWMQHCKERPPLQLNCFRAIYMYIRRLGWPSNSIYKPLMDCTMPFLSDIDYQLVHKIQGVTYPLSTGSDMIC